MKPREISLTRDLPLERGRAALLVIDVQRYCCDPAGGMFKGLAKTEIEDRYGEYLSRLRDTVVPNLQRLLAGCRDKEVEVLFTFIEALTSDGRDMRDRKSVV